MKKLAIIGSGELGLQIAHYAKADNHYSVIGFFDDFKSNSETVANYPILGKTCEILELYTKSLFDCVLIALGYKHINLRENIFMKLNGKVPFGKMIHSSCIMDSSAKIADGCVLYPGCILDKNVVLGANVLLNLRVTIAHDSRVGEHSFLSPCVSIAGFSTVGKKCVLGINSTIIDNINITDNVQLGGATVVIKNIEQGGLYVGNPARFVRQICNE